MKITIDTFNKEISLESNESIKDIVDFMQKHFPEEWMNFKIKGTSLTVTFPYQDPIPYNPPYYTNVAIMPDLWSYTLNTANSN